MITWRAAALFTVAGVVGMIVVAALDVSAWWALGGAAGLVGLLTALDWLVAAPAGEVRLRREGATQVRLGDAATVTLYLTNESVRPMRAVIRDAWVPSAGATEPYAHAAVVDPGETVAVPTVLRPTRRGERPAARVTIRSYGPLSLAFRQTGRRRSDEITPPWTVRALPDFPSRRLLPEKLSRLRIVEGQVVTRVRGQGSEFDSLREYVVGDDPRGIDWRASARRAHLVSKQWRPERDRRVLCVLDTGRTSAGRIDTGDRLFTEDQEAAGVPRLDLAIDAALLLSSVAAYAGDKVDILAIDTQTQIDVTASSQQHLDKLHRALATLQPALVETDFGRVVAEVLRSERKRALVVLFTTLDPGALGEGLIPVLPTLVARHTVLLAAVHDPALEALAAGRGSADAIHTAAAAERGLAELRRVRAALTRHRVSVVDEPAQTFASAVTDHYLALKAAGRL